MSECFTCHKKLNVFSAQGNKKFIIRNGYIPPDNMTEHDTLCQSCLDEIKRTQTRGKNMDEKKVSEREGEIAQIADRLDEDEKVIMVIRQTKNPLKPGSSLITPDTIFATTKKIIIRNPSALGLRQNIEIYNYEQIVDVKLEKGMFSSRIGINVPGSLYDGIIEALPKNEAEELLKIIYERMKQKKTSTSDDDPLTILKKRFAKGEITKEEYEDMKSVLE